MNINNKGFSRFKLNFFRWSEYWT